VTQMSFARYSLLTLLDATAYQIMTGVSYPTLIFIS
jgi:hypothetical protein